MKISQQLAALIVSLSLFSCTKSQEELYPEHKIIDININGYIAADSLQLKLGNRVVEATEDGSSHYFQGKVSTKQVSNGPTTFSVFDSKGVQLLERKIDGAALSNTVKFYYDGTSLIDKLPEIPKPTPGNVGILVNFPERTFSKIPVKDIAIEVYIAKRGQPTIRKVYPLNEEGNAYADLTVPATYTSMTLKVVKAASPSELYLDNSKTSIVLMNVPKPDKGALMLIKEYADGGNFMGIQGIELTQYLN
ncbi:hypothetical protein HHL17_10945 [Chitinophaga sp. G-6-1-13]|uniref:Uncharacterized protein n=1 Tax=Chitinophaga fulva TaxID=2728842 RepID=A0A848GLZ0_9BACT|nr:hypothetical protein [Chitinophaga fulva]NML37710.1 hypothetical protein [Chitinophaga fulva]